MICYNHLSIVTVVVTFPQSIYDRWAVPYQPLLCIFYRISVLERYLKLLGHTVYIPVCTVCP
jgi:hypothetical protein